MSYFAGDLALGSRSASLDTTRNITAPMTRPAAGIKMQRIVKIRPVPYEVEFSRHAETQRLAQAISWNLSVSPAKVRQCILSK